MLLDAKCQMTSSGIVVTLCVVSWEKGVWCHLLLAPSKPHQEGLGRHEDVTFLCYIRMVCKCQLVSNLLILSGMLSVLI